MNSLKQRERENALNEIRLLASINDKYIVAYKVFLSLFIIRIHFWMKITYVQ